MVAVLLRLRFRVLANTLRRNTAQLIAVILEALQAVVMLAVATIGFFVVSTGAVAATQDVVVIGGTALFLGWVFVPLLFSGVEQTIDPVKLARFPVRPRQLMTAMMIIGIAWIPGIATVAASVATAIAWRSDPIAATAASIGGVIGAVTAIAASRLATSVVGALLRGHGAARLVTGGLAGLVVLGPIAASVVGGVTAGGRSVLEHFTAATAVLAWTPFGAIWSVPGRLEQSDLLGAAGAAAIALATLVAVFVLWRVAIGRSLRVQGAGAARGSGRAGAGILRWAPSGQTGAIAARSLIYWVRDARLSRQLVLVPILPALTLLLWGLDHFDALAIAAGPLAACLLPLSVFAGVSYDGTAFAAELAVGVRGSRDRLGRAIALVVIAAPAVVAVQIVVALVIGRSDDLPALLGLSLGTLFVTTGVVSVSSALIVVPVSRSRRNPFSAPAGAATTSVLASYLVMGATVVIALPLIAVTVVALVTGSVGIGWLALGVGVLGGGGAAVGGVLLGGRTLDRTAPALLARLRLIRA